MSKLTVLISKKGTKVVIASDLYYELQLPKQHFIANFKKWLDDVYEFRDGIRKPIPFKDYSRRKVKDNPLFEDYYLTLELAKLIALKSKSKVKLKYAKQLYQLDQSSLEEARAKRQRKSTYNVQQNQTALPLWQH